MTFETLKWKYTFATNVLIVTRDESPLVYSVPDASEQSFQDMSYWDKHDSGLHNCTISSYYVKAVRTESRYKCQFGSNLISNLLYLKLSSSTRDNEFTH